MIKAVETMMGDPQRWIYEGHGRDLHIALVDVDYIMGGWFGTFHHPLVTHRLDE